MNRRSLLGMASAGLLSACVSPSPKGEAAPTLVLVHGAWHGAWCWERVIPLLDRAGIASAALTLPGMGDRSRELSVGIDLNRHIEAVADAARSVQGPVVLVGHSYAGFVITGAADRLGPSSKLRSLIYLDAFVPADGEMAADYMPPESRAKLSANFAAGNAAYPPIPARFFGLDQLDDIAWVQSKLTAQPAGTYLQPLRLVQGHQPSQRRSYIACQSPKLPVFDATKARIRSDASWTYRELQTGHDAMVSAPSDLARLLVQLA